MCLHGLACFPLSNHTIGIFLFEIPVYAVAETAFFFANSARKRVYTLDQKPDRFPPESDSKELLLAFLPGLVALVVGLIVGLLLSFFVVIV